MKNLDAYHDALLAKHNEDYDYDAPWTVADYEGEGGGYIVVDEDGNEDRMGFVFDTAHEAQRYANELNKAVEEDYDD